VKRLLTKTPGTLVKKALHPTGNSRTAAIACESSTTH
jgi:hypothetical protein